MNITITENKKNNTVVVQATADGDITKKDAASTGTIEAHLRENNIKFGKCLKNDSVCNRNGKMNGEWVFELDNNKKIVVPVGKKVDKPTPPVVSSKGAKRTRKSSKAQR